NIAAKGWAVVHLESGDEAVIMEGEAERIRDQNLFGRVDEAYKKKYRMGLTGIPGDVGVFTVRPKVVFAWREKEFPKSATRCGFCIRVSGPFVVGNELLRLGFLLSE